MVISGTGFSTTSANNHVLIGLATCTVTSATSTAITCTVGEGTPGSREVKVVVTTKGAASADSPVMFRYNFAASSVEPASGYSSGMVLFVCVVIF